MAHLLVIKNTA